MTTSPQHWLADGPGFRSDRYFRYDDMTAMLHHWAEDHPGLCQVTSAGKTVVMLKILDEKAGGHGYQAWREFEHPQLGPVEIGGFEFKFALQNPPGPMLDEVASRNGRSVMRLMGVTPRITFTDEQADRLKGSTACRRWCRTQDFCQRG